MIPVSQELLPGTELGQGKASNSRVGFYQLDSGIQTPAWIPIF